MIYSAKRVDGPGTVCGTTNVGGWYSFWLRRLGVARASRTAMCKSPCCGVEGSTAAQRVTTRREAAAAGVPEVRLMGADADGEPGSVVGGDGGGGPELCCCLIEPGEK